MRKLYLVLLIVLFAVNSNAQVNSYSFSGSTGSFNPLTGGAISTAVGDDGTQTAIPIGFTFNYNNTAFSTFGVSANGLIVMGSGAVPSFTNALASNANVIAPLWDNNNLSGGSITYLTTGAVGSRILTVEWTNMHVGGGGSSTNPTITLQTKLFETSGVINFVYASTSATLLATTASIGISGAVGNFLSVTPLSPPNTSTVSSATENTGISSAANFPSGTTYSFTPPPCVPPDVDQPADQVVCNNTSTAAINFTGSVPGTVFNWTNNSPSIGLAASGTGNISSFNATNATNAPLVATVTVTPVSPGVSGSQTFSYTGAIQNWTVPAGVTSITVEAYGASGGNSTANIFRPGGKGVYAKGDIAVTPGQVLKILVGQAGETDAVGGGGGGSFVALLNNTPLMVAGGGGGASSDAAGVDASILNNGTAESGGVILGGTGGNGGMVCLSGNNNGGSGGGFTGNGMDADPGGGNVNFGRGGLSFVNGGIGGAPGRGDVLCTADAFGGFGGGGSTTCNTVGGGGGGGYSGGAGGRHVGNCGATFRNGGGGGGSFNIGTNQLMTAGVQTGNGQVIISYSSVTGSNCPGTPKTFTITVNPTPNVVATPVAQTICSGAAITPIVSSGNVAGTIYNWTRNNTATVTGIGASGAGDINGSLINTTNAPITVTFTITPTYTNAGTTCSGTATTATVTVNPTATVNTVGNQVVCNGSPTTAVTFSSPTTGGTIVYNWTNNTTSIGLAASGTGNIASFVGTNTTVSPVIATITVTPTYTNGGTTCAGTATTFTITVNPTATVNTVSNQAVCNGSPTTAVTFSSPTTGGTIVYNWTNNTTSIGLAASGTGNIASFVVTNTTTSPVTATITVTPTYTNGGTSCAGTATTFTITVNPTATVNTVSNQAVCNGSPTTAVTFSSPTTGGTIVYNWTNNNAGIGLAASGSGNIPSFTATNTSQSAIVASITVTPTFTNGGVSCVGTARTFTITVNPTPSVTLAPFTSICRNATPITLTGGTPTTGGTGIYFVNGVQQTVFNPANYTPGLHTIVYQFTTTSGCVNTATQQIRVNAIHTVEITVTPSGGLAPGQPATIVATVSPVDNYTYSWSKNGLPVFTPTNTDRIVVLANDAGNYQVTVTSPAGCVVSSAIAFTPSQIVANTLFIFPNPTTGIFNVAYNNGQPNQTARRLNVYNYLGQRVFSQSYSVNVSFGNMRVDISKYATGTYTVELVDSNGKKLGVGRVIKK